MNKLNNYRMKERKNLFRLVVLIIFFCTGPMEIAAIDAVPKNKVYDLIINGAGLDGYFSAIEASKKGLSVLILDKRTSPGYDIAAKRKLWIDDDGLEAWDKNMLDLFFPVEEQKEIRNQELTSPRKSRFGNELLVFAGSLKKEMLGSLLKHKVDVLMMNDVCGIMTDSQKRVTGVVVASKYGVFSIRGGNYLDATDNNLFTRNLFGHKYLVSEASFVLEFDMVAKNNIRELKMPGIGVKDDKIHIHAGKKDADQCFVEFDFPVKTNELAEIEQQARRISMEISKNIRVAHEAFLKARLHYTALECAIYVNESVSGKIPLSNYYVIGNSRYKHSCRSIQESRENVAVLVNNIRPYTASWNTTDVYYAGGKTAYSETKDLVYEDGFPTMLSVFPVEILRVKPQQAQLLVVGAGTAGAMVALGAARKNTPVTVVEYFNDMGGTKTVGGVNDFYFGLQNHQLILDLEKERRTFGFDHNMALGRSTIPRRFHLLDMLINNKVNIISGAIMCGVETENQLLKSIFICENGKIKKINAKLTVDATGDGTVAHFAGEDWSTGDSRMNITQNYSHWDVAYRPEKKDYNRDYDIINSTQMLEYQRGLYLAHSEAHFYDFYPMQAIRESRRPNAVYNINVSDILRDVRYDDIISQTRSDYDPHYFANSELSRCGFMLPHYDNKTSVNIPYRSIVPAKIDGLLLSGKAIGQTYKALQFTRMSADVMVLGYVTGLIASDIISQNIQPRDFNAKSICEELVSINYLPAGLNNKPQESVDEIVVMLENGNKDYLLKAVLENKSQIVPLLNASFNNNKSLLIAKAMAWFGQKTGNVMIVDELEELYRQELLIGHTNSFFETYDPDTLYWSINQNIGLLAMSSNPDNNDVINKILSETVSGGPMVFSADAYKQGRIDLQLLPYYNRIANLIFYVERNPAGLFVNQLEKLLDDEHIKNHKTTEYDKTRWRVYNANLELLLAAASGRCGSEKGLQILVSYLDDIHSDFRKFALNELVQITTNDFGYNQNKWCKFLDKNKTFNLCPLDKYFEI